MVSSARRSPHLETPQCCAEHNTAVMGEGLRCIANDPIDE